MKSIYVLPLIVIAIIAATLLHQLTPLTVDYDMHFDEFASGLKSIKPFLSANKNVSVNSTDLQLEKYLWCRYLLAPGYCPDAKKETMDTILTICSITAADSIVNSVVKNRKVIWSNKNSQYQYYLTSNQ